MHSQLSPGPRSCLQWNQADSTSAIQDGKTTGVIMQLGEGMQNIGAVLGTIAAALVAGSALIYRAWARLKLDRQQANTETATLQLLDAAVVKWKTLYDTAWEQVVKERDLRMQAESRAAKATSDVEVLRSEVASLQREVERLTSIVTGQGHIGG